MNFHKKSIADIAAGIGLNQAEIDGRMRFLEFSEKDIALLLQVHQLLQQDKDGFSDAFYQHLTDFPQLQAMLPNTSTVERLRKIQSGYFDRLTAGNYDTEYIHDRLNVGVVHQRVGLGPKWYIGAYRKYLSELLVRMSRLFPDDPELFLSAYNAVLKIVSFDMGLALDTYFEADRQTVLQHQNYLEQIISGMPAGLMVVDAQLKLRSMNQMMRKMLELDDDSIVGNVSLQDFIPGQSLQQSVEQASDDGQPVENLLATVKGRDGNERYFEFNIRRTEQAGEQLLLLIAKDITEQRQAALKLQESEEHFRVIFTQAGVGIAYTTSNGQLVRANPKMSEIFGYTEAELLDKRFHDFTHPDDLESSVALASSLVDGQIKEYVQEKRYIHKDGHAIWAHVTVSSMRDVEGRTHYVTVIKDITARKKAEDKLVYFANHDSLTKLPNRLLLNDRLSQAILQAKRTGRKVGVMFVDLDRFKNINDSLGHDRGDQVIVEIGQRLSARLRSIDTVARQGGDEFVIVLPDLKQTADASVVAQKVQDALCQPMLVDGHEIFPSGSIGISIFPDDGDDCQALLKNADTAMYQAKAAGRHNVKFYASDMNANSLDHLKIEGALRRALEREEFVLYYQPQVDIRTGKLIAVEALIRWQKSPQQMVPPAEFIPIAEETGLIVPIGDWILAKACQQHKAWCAAGLPKVKIHVNLSARQFHRRDLAKHVERLFHETECGADSIGLEITESVVMDNPEEAAATLRDLSDMGVHLAIDDFGTGYSSLSYLKRFPIDTLKIDRSFVRDIATDADDASIVRSVIALAQSMKLDLVAEGVEEGSQRDFLSDNGCNVMQGYLFSPPVPADQLEKLLREKYACHDDSAAAVLAS